jgi:Holliday junction resolvase
VSTTPYRRGYEFEQRTKQRLYDNGAAYVISSRGSKSPVDLVAFWPPDLPWFVQCKGGKGRMTKAQKAELISFAHSCGAVAVLATRGLHFEILT